MLGSQNLGRLGWYLAALSFVCAFATVGVGHEDKVTICNFPPDNPDGDHEN